MEVGRGLVRGPAMDLLDFGIEETEWDTWMDHAIATGQEMWKPLTLQVQTAVVEGSCGKGSVAYVDQVWPVSLQDFLVGSEGSVSKPSVSCMQRQCSPNNRHVKIMIKDSACCLMVYTWGSQVCGHLSLPRQVTDPCIVQMGELSHDGRVCSSKPKCHTFLPKPPI